MIIAVVPSMYQAGNVNMSLKAGRRSNSTMSTRSCKQCLLISKKPFSALSRSSRTRPRFSDGTWFTRRCKSCSHWSALASWSFASAIRYSTRPPLTSSGCLAVVCFLNSCWAVRIQVACVWCITPHAWSTTRNRRSAFLVSAARSSC